jgi:hypothetical protein
MSQDSLLQHINEISNPTSLDSVIRAETGRKLRSFLYNLSEGVTDYRTIHSLTEQVRHQYHGRFAIELIQNAYDAVSRAEDRVNSHCRIEMRLELDRKFGTLYVANDGAPFSHSNFESVSRLGQSDKDPTTSVGNKGIGFRSVLEISLKPRIWSRRFETSPGFDGYCFGFDPAFVRSVHEPIIAIIEERVPSGDYGWFGEIVEEDASLCDRLRAGARRRSTRGASSITDWLREEIGHLSPYLLPWPLTGRSNTADDFAERGFASVVELPLTSPTALALTERKLAEITADSVLFLDNLKSLTIATPKGARTFQRSILQRANGPRKLGQVSIRSEESTRIFLIWRRHVQVSDMPESVQDSIRGLPGQWPKLERAEIAVAVSDNREPLPGKLSIFLPTTLETGSALHINAPFFGDMSRTTISFDTDEEGAQAGGTYNEFLLHQAAVLSLEAISGDLAGRSVSEAGNILDILAPIASQSTANDRWQEHLSCAATEMDIEIENAPWMLCDDGWYALCQASLLPLPSDPKVLDADVLRENAVFPVFERGLMTRFGSIEILSNHFWFDVLPTEADKAETIEASARALAQVPGLNWGHFWQDVCDIFDNDLSHLQGKDVLLCTDGTLHSGGVRGRAIYFRPRQGGQDEDSLEEPGIDQVPAALQPFIAILDPKIPVSEVRDGRRQNTDLHKHLTDAKLVNTFRREDVLADILTPNLPAMPVARGTADAGLCRDALFYSLRLAASLASRGDGESLAKAMAKIPVPCSGGWYPLSQATFGKGWSGTQGPVVDRYLRLVCTKSAKAARARLLRAPGDPEWGEFGETVRHLLESAGVADGLPLMVIGGKEPAFTCQVSHHRFQSPSLVPPPIDEEAWSTFINQINSLKSSYKSGRYKIGTFRWLPGLEARASFSDETKDAFLDVVMASAPIWDSNWRSVDLMRDTGTYEHVPLDSPLFIALANYDWIPNGDDESSRSWSVPAGRWYIPTRYTANGRTWTFDHLGPLPAHVAVKIERSDALRSLFTGIGVGNYDPETRTSDARLLDALGEAVEKRTFRNPSTLIGQLRAAWEAFYPSSPADFPTRLVVQQSDGNLALLEPSADNPVYLPSSRSSTSDLRALGLSVIAMEPKAAQRLAEDFSERFGASVRNSERFELVALSGDEPFADAEAQELPAFRDLDGVIPLVLTIAAFHGQNAQGTLSASFNDLLSSFRDARVIVVSELSVVPMINAQGIAAPIPQTAAWLARKRTLVLDTEWKSDIQSVADSLSQLIGRSDLRVQIRAGLDEIWPDSLDMLPERTLKLLDLSPDHYNEVLELWRGDLGPVISLLARLARVLSRDDLVFQIEAAEQHDQLLSVLSEFLGSQALAQELLDGAVTSRDVFQFGIFARRLLGPEVELAEWNREDVRHDELPTTNPSHELQFREHRSRMLPVLRRIVATLAVQTPDAPSFTTMMKRLDELSCPSAAAEAYWELPASEAAGAIVAELAAAGFALDQAALCDVLASDEPGGAVTCLPVEVPLTDPVAIASENRRLLEALYSRFMLIGTAWHAAAGQNEGSAWREAKLADPTTSARTEDRDVFTMRWDEARVLEFIRAELPTTSPQQIRGALRDAKSLDAVMTALQVNTSEMEDAEERLAAQKAAADRKKRMVSVCGGEIDNSESGLADLFAHISTHVPDSSVCALEGFDLSAVTLPQKAKRPKKGEQKERTKRTRAPRKTRRNMEDLIGAAGEIHAFRWLQLKYGSEVITPSNWVSAYSAKAFPDNALYVDEGRGCDIVFTLDSCTFHIEVKSSEEDGTGFTLGTSEILCAREIAQKRRRRDREKYFVLKVDHALSSEPKFTLLPNPYDPAHQDRFVIVDEGARVTYRT